MKPETYNYERVRPVRAGNGVTFKITVRICLLATLQNAHWRIMYLLIHSTAVVDNIQSSRSFAALMCHHRRPTRVVRLVRNLSRVADHGLAPYHSVNNGRIHKSPQIDLLHPLNLVVCVDNEVFYLFGSKFGSNFAFHDDMSSEYDRASPPRPLQRSFSHQPHPALYALSSPKAKTDHGSR